MLSSPRHESSWSLSVRLAEELCSVLPSAGLLEFRKLYEVPVDFRHVPAACGGREGGRNNVL